MLSAAAQLGLGYSCPSVSCGIEAVWERNGTSNQPLHLSTVAFISAVHPPMTVTARLAGTTAEPCCHVWHYKLRTVNSQSCTWPMRVQNARSPCGCIVMAIVNM